MKSLIAWAALATIAAAVFALLYFGGNSDHINELEGVKAQYRADSTVTALLIQRRDSQLVEVMEDYSDLLKSVASRRPIRDRLHERTDLLRLAPDDSLAAILDRDPPER